ncbi:hypothetical protein WJX81_002635 [Elliptochloris bilobata]|uniref:AB hydrolase-1 domain-containing protein n=1 Tax=Elliptochloris bilobata TaxID=381761 RepID=A0AAW1S3P6_9CHLO
MNAYEPAAPPVESEVLKSSHVLPDGAQLELLELPASTALATWRPALLFVHGSFHAAWCWREHFMPYFAARGWDTLAVSLRGQGASDRPAGKTGGTLASHAVDLGNLVRALPRPPVMIGHSFGGLVVQRYLADGDAAPRLAGAALMCSAPPSGNSALVGRLVRQSPLLAARLTWGMVSKAFLRDPGTCREMYFSADMAACEVERLQGLLALHASPIPVVDVSAVRAETPLAPPPAEMPPIFVMTGAADVITDVPAAEETAAQYGVRPVVVPGVAHDFMLDVRWRDAAEALETWLVDEYQ